MPAELKNELDAMTADEDQLYASMVPEGGPYSVAVINQLIDAWNATAPALGVRGDFPKVKGERGATVTELPAELVRGLVVAREAIEAGVAADVLDADLTPGQPETWTDDNALAMLGGTLRRASTSRSWKRWLSERPDDEDDTDEDTAEQPAMGGEATTTTQPDDAEIDRALGLS